MGNSPVKSVHATPPDLRPPHMRRLFMPQYNLNHTWMDDCDASHYSGLTADEARDMALQWLPELQRYVRVRLWLSQRESLFPVCGRVWFKIEGNVNEAAAVVHATLVVWTLIAQCPGYSVDGNPEFWQRILATMISPDKEMLFGRVGLYPSNSGGSSFLCIGISAWCPSYTEEMQTEVWRIIAGVNEYLYPAIQSTLDDIRARLTLHTRPHRARPVVLALLDSFDNERTRSSSTLSWFKEAPMVHNFILSRVIQNYTNSEPWVSVVDANRRELTRGNEVTSLLNDGSIEPPRHVNIDGSTTVRWSKRFSQVNYQDVMAFFSSLPFTSSTLNTINYASSYMEMDDTIRVVPWIFYAIFHPDTPRGCATALSIDGVSMTDLMTLMDTEVPYYTSNDPNTLTRTVRHKTTHSMKRIDKRRRVYKRTTLKAGTNLRGYPDPDAPIILTLPRSTYVDLLEYLPTTATEWRNVIVRSIGSCWVEAQAVTGPVQHRLALKSPCIRELSIDWARGGREPFKQYPDRFAQPVLRLSGHLTKLDITTFIIPFSDRAINKILTANPLLKSLAITHNGSVWRDEGTVWCRKSEWPRLEVLKLRVRGYQYYAPSEMSITSGSLRNLRTFVARVWCEETFLKSRGDFGWLINTHSTLSYIVISPFAYDGNRWDYAQGKSLSDQHLLAAGVQVNKTVSQSNRSITAVALMSVIRRLQARQPMGTSGLAAFGSDVIECVMSFVGTGDRRVVWYGRWMDY